MTRTLVAAVLVSAATVGTVEAQQYGPPDQFAMVKVVNTSDIVLNFDYRFGQGPWQSVSLAPGQWHGMFAGFTYPGSYRHDAIEIRFDDDLRYGLDHWQYFLPYVTFTPSVDYNRAYVYQFNYTTPSRQFVGMFPVI